MFLNCRDLQNFLVRPEYKKLLIETLDAEKGSILVLFVQFSIKEHENFEGNISSVKVKSGWEKQWLVLRRTLSETKSQSSYIVKGNFILKARQLEMWLLISPPQILGFAGKITSSSTPKLTFPLELLFPNPICQLICIISPAHLDLRLPPVSQRRVLVTPQTSKWKWNEFLFGTFVSAKNFLWSGAQWKSQQETIIVDSYHSVNTEWERENLHFLFLILLCFAPIHRLRSPKENEHFYR